MATARTKANDKYNKKAYGRFLVTVKKGEQEKIKAHATSKNESLNSFVNRAINETIERDNNEHN